MSSKLKISLSTPSQYARTAVPNVLKSPANFQLHESVKANDIVLKPSDFFLSKQGESTVSTSLPSSPSILPTYQPPCKETANVNLISPKQFHIELTKKNDKPIDDFQYAAFQAETKALQLKLEALEKDYELKKVELNVSIENSSAVITSLTEENKSLKTKISEMERSTFNEVKDVYDKYISLQKQHDKEKQYLDNQFTELENKLKVLKDEYHDTVEKYDSVNNENTLLKESVCVEKVNYSSIEEKMHHEVKTLQLELEGLYREKSEAVTQIELSNNFLQTTKENLNEKVTENDNLKKNLQSEKENLKRTCIAHNEKVQILEQNINQLDGKLKKEVINIHSTEALLKEREYQLVKAEKIVTHLRRFIEEANHKDIAQRNSVYKQMELQQHEIQTLQHTCKTLQATNEILNVRLSSLNDVLRLQESSLGGVVDGDRNEKLLNVWRQKVYNLLVKLKMYELKEENNFEVSSNRSL